MHWGDVDLTGRELVIRAEKAKTRRARRLPTSTRLLAVLQMRRTAPDGQTFGPEVYVFGDALGGRVVSIRTAWEAARQRAGLEDFHLADGCLVGPLTPGCVTSSAGPAAHVAPVPCLTKT